MPEEGRGEEIYRRSEINDKIHQVPLPESKTKSEPVSSSESENTNDTPPVEQHEVDSNREMEQRGNRVQVSQETQAKRPTKVTDLICWIKNPPASDRIVVQNEVAIPAFLASIITTPIALNSANPIVSTTSAIIASSGFFTMLGMFGLMDRMHKLEVKHRILFSKLFTVSRVFTSNKSLLQPAFVKINPDFKSGFTGELHFDGINVDSWDGVTTELAAFRDMAEGLYNLSVACEQDDSRLIGITLFGGVSSKLNPKLEKYGFHIFKENELKKTSITDRIFRLLAKLRGSKTLTYPNGVIYTSGEKFVGVINRDEIIQHKNDYARLAKIGTNLTPNSDISRDAGN